MSNATYLSNHNFMIGQLIHEIYEWMHCNKLKLNPDKMECIWIASRHLHGTLVKPSLSIGEAIVQPSTGARNLGVFFDDQVNFKQHITCVVSVTFSWDSFERLGDLCHKMLCALFSNHLLLIDWTTVIHYSVACQRVTYVDSNLCRMLRRTSLVA